MAKTWHIDPAFWHSEWTEPGSGSAVSLIVIATNEVGYGPRLHRHPYPETFIIRVGAARFYVDEEIFLATAGDIVVAPAHTAHRFENAGPGRLETIDIHASAEFITEWLD
jgi:mannose-6-phosphate isomerase-like protein (cupin superfamily)